MKNLFIIFIYFNLGLRVSIHSEQKNINFSISTKLLTSSVESPVAFAYPSDSSNRLFIVEQRGKIKIFKQGKLVREAFININKKLSNVNIFYSEKGLLGLAFHPNFKRNRKFYINYSAVSDKANHKTIISELYASRKNPDIAITKERVVMEIEQPESNHNGGTIAFGPDGFLYIGSGDGGGGGDRHGLRGNGQDLTTLLGKILRIDVQKGLNAPYTIPSSNPFISNENHRKEIWAYGLRNPWKLSFDRKTGKLYCGDVGQNLYEEINIIEKGKNYGWRVMEGMHCYKPRNCKKENYELPIHEYGHKIGKSIIGGYIYRGKNIKFLKGKYVFADWMGGIFLLEKNNNKWERRAIQIKNKNKFYAKYINSLGEGPDGELYILGQRSQGPGNRGYLYQLTP